MQFIKASLLAAAGLFIGSFNRADALVLLTVDVSNPSLVTFTSTTNFASQASSLTTSDGFTIENFFTTTQSYGNQTVFTGNLTAPGGSFSYEILQTFNFETGGDFGFGNDLSIYTFSVSNPQTFTTGNRAFTGAGGVNFSASASALPAPGTTGAIYAGYIKSGEPQHVLIGQWSVIPEPSSAMVLALGLIPLCRRRR